jgi:hypothetical protein
LRAICKNIARASLMMYCLLSAPSPASSVVLRLAQAIVKVGCGSCQTVTGNAADIVEGAIARSTKEVVLLYCEAPGARAGQAIRRAGVPVALVVSAPTDIVATLASSRNLGGLDGLRFASQCLAALHDFAIDPAVAMMGSRVLEIDVETGATFIAEAFGIILAPPGRDAVLALLQGKAPNPKAPLGSLIPPAAASAPAPSPAVDTNALHNLEGYLSLLDGNPATTFDWSPNVFLGDRPLGQPLRTPVKLIGGRRCFAFGPFLHLPPGQWRASVNFSVYDNYSGNVLKIDIFTDKIEWEGKARLPALGRLVADIVFRLDDPELPVQVRLMTEQGAIEGEVDLHGVTIDRIA